MKLAPRLIAVTAGTVFIASALAGVLLVRMERAQLIADELTESRVLLRSLQVSVENALRDGQDPDIVELLGRLELIARRVDVLVFAPGPASTPWVSTLVSSSPARACRPRTRSNRRGSGTCPPWPDASGAGATGPAMDGA